MGIITLGGEHPHINRQGFIDPGSRLKHLATINLSRQVDKYMVKVGDDLRQAGEVLEPGRRGQCPF